MTALVEPRVQTGGGGPDREALLADATRMLDSIDMDPLIRRRVMAELVSRDAWQLQATVEQIRDEWLLTVIDVVVFPALLDHCNRTQSIDDIMERDSEIDVADELEQLRAEELLARSGAH